MTFNILNIKFFSELFFFLSDFYFILNIFLLLFLGLIFTKYLHSLYTNVLLIDLSILSVIFLFFFNYFLYDLNIDLFLGFKLNSFYVFFKFIMLFFLFFFLIISRNVFVFDKIYNFEYILLILFSIQAFFFIAFTKNLFIFFLSIEMQLLCSYVLAALKRYSNFSTEAGIKYFLFGAFSSSLLLFGVSFLYGLYGTLDIISIYFIINNYFNYNYLLLFSLFFIFIGLFFKLGAVPFHWWLPDVYEGSLSIVTLFFSVFPKLTLIFFFIKISYFIFLFNFNLLFFLIGFFSIIVGFINAMFQFKIKRFLAYSSIFTIGFLIIILSQGNIDSFFVVFFYLLCYSITLMSFFFLLLHIRLRFFKEFFYLYELSYVLKSNVIISIFFVILFFSFAGVPPLIGFFSKFYLFLFLINNYNFFLVFIVLLCGVISSFYYVRVIRILLFNNLKNYNKLYIIELSYCIFFLIFINILFFLFFDFIGEFLFLSLFKSFLI